FHMTRYYYHNINSSLSYMFCFLMHFILLFFTLSLHDALPISSDDLLSFFVSPGLINNHICKDNIGKVKMIAIKLAIIKYIQIISPGLVTVSLKSISFSKNR